MEIGLEESADYLSRQLITYIGNKRSLLDFIGSGLLRVSDRLGKRKLDIFDVFSGSGVVARYFKRHARRLVVNDIERYAEVTNECYLANGSETDQVLLGRILEELSAQLRPSLLKEGFIYELSAPKN
ncbi:MAG: DNA adenine methylase, partial [Spirochaetota bacterium]